MVLFGTFLNNLSLVARAHIKLTIEGKEKSCNFYFYKEALLKVYWQG